MASVQTLAPPWLRFRSAADWGIKWKRPPVAERLADPETYIHHTAGGRFGLDPEQAMRSLQQWYHDVKNYSTIAYDVMVHRNVADDTVAILGAREGWLSAATRDRNDIGEAVCLFGYFTPGHQLSERPTARELEALAFAVAWSIENNWSARDTKVMGHRENPAHPGDTTCPGDYLFPHVASIGARARQLLDMANAPAPTPTPPPPPPPTPTPTELALLSRVRAGDGWWSIARRCYGNANVADNAKRLELANPAAKVLKPGQLVNVPGLAR